MTMTQLALLFLTVTLLLLGNSSNGQTADSIPKNKLHGSDFSKCGHNFILTAGINRTNFTSYEISVGRSYSAEYNAVILETYSQYEIGMEILIDQDKYFYAPKLSCELDVFKFICLSRLNLLYYINPNGQSSLKYRHEIGLTYRGYVNLNYSYTFGLTNKDFYKLGHGVNLQLNIPLGKRRQDRVN